MSDEMTVMSHEYDEASGVQDYPEPGVYTAADHAAYAALLRSMGKGAPEQTQEKRTVITLQGKTVEDIIAWFDRDGSQRIDEADAVTVRDADFGAGWVLVTITHGRCDTLMSVTRGEAARLRDALTDYLDPEPEQTQE